MEELRCMVHCEQRALVFCNQCSSHQLACLHCFQKTGRHYNHRIVTLEDGYSLQMDKYVQFVDLVTDKRNQAKKEHSRKMDVDQQLHSKVVQSCEELDEAIEKVLRELQEMRITLLTVLQQAAQTVRSKTLNKLAMSKQMTAARQSATWVRKTRKCVNLEGLVGLIASVSTLEKNCNTLATALEVGSSEFKLDGHIMSIASRVTDELASLADRARILRVSSIELLGKKSATVAPFKLSGGDREVLHLVGGDNSCSNFIYDPASRVWCEAATMRETRWRPAAAFWNGKVVVAGGAKASTDNIRMKSVEQYDPQTNQWSSLPDLLTSRSSFGLVVFEKSLYAIGGWNGEKYLGVVERYDSALKQWTFAAPLQVPRHSHVSAQLLTKMVTAGGYNGEFTETCEVFDSSSKEWRFLAPLILARTGAASASHNDKFYIFGGFGKEGKCLDDVEEYDCATNKWTELPVRLSMPRAKSAAANANGLIFICGGWGNQASDTVECFNAEDMSLTTVATLPLPSYGHDVVSARISNEIYNQLFHLYK